VKVLIQKDGIKREIVGPFRMCLSGGDARSIVRCLSEMADSGCHGWIDIYDAPAGPLTEGAPLPWAAE